MNYTDLIYLIISFRSQMSKKRNVFVENMFLPTCLILRRSQSLMFLKLVSVLGDQVKKQVIYH